MFVWSAAVAGLALPPILALVVASFCACVALPGVTAIVASSSVDSSLSEYCTRWMVYPS